MRTHTIFLALGLAAITGGAGAQQPPQPRPQQLPPVTADVTANAVTVQNQRKAPVTVYVDFGRIDRRIGEVPAFGEAVLPLPEWAVKGRARVRLYAHVKGESTDLTTSTFALEPPARLGIVIPASTFAAAPADTMLQVIPPELITEATLTVDNARDVPCDVFAAPGALDMKLGQVPAHDRITLRVPKALVGLGHSVQVFVRPLHSAELSGASLRIDHGQHLGLRIPPR